MAIEDYRNNSAYRNDKYGKKILLKIIEKIDK